MFGVIAGNCYHGKALLVYGTFWSCMSIIVQTFQRIVTHTMCLSLAKMGKNNLQKWIIFVFRACY